MDIANMVTLAVLALADSTSVGTLVIPILMLVRPSFQPRRVVLYLATLCIFYFALGLALVAGAGAALSGLEAAMQSRVMLWAQVVIGAVLLVVAFVIDPGKKHREGRKQGRPPEPSRWEQRLDSRTGAGAIVGLALLAGVIEAASMVPYLAALGIITAAKLSVAGVAGLIAAYVTVMAVPALLLLAGRCALGSRVTGSLERLGAWVSWQVAETIPWVMGIVGVVLASGALGDLGVLA